MSSAHLKATAIVPKFSSAFSVIGSASIIWVCLRDKKERLDKTYHRLMLGMSLADLMSSSAWFLTTWPIPKGSPYVWGAVGTQQTCTAQGFFAQLSISVVLYNGFLSLYYLVIVAYNWKRKAVLRAEKVVHVLTVFTGVATAVAGIPLTLYNNLYGNCWINGLPLNCKESWKNRGETTCDRGDNYTIYQWIFFYAPLFFAMTAITVAMTLVMICSVRKEKVMRQYLERGVQVSKVDSKEVIRQCFLYIAGFYVSWIPIIVFRIVELARGMAPFWIVMVMYCTLPVQGLFNAIVYHSVSTSHAALLL